MSHGPATAASLIGQILDGKYRLDSLIGKGGMGAVFRGHHVAMDRRVAIKIIHPELSQDPAVGRRFVREAKGTFAVDSDHAIRVLDFAASTTPIDGLLYMVMEYLDGRTIARELEVDGALAPRRALHVARQTAEALAAAHRVGLVHRDIKPENIMLIRVGDDPDYAKVLDFGLAKLIQGAPGDAALSAAALTQAGMVFGTPDYMSPEQATAKPLDQRSDLYALGASLFEMLVARRPFLGETPMQVLVQHVKAPPPHLADVAPRLAPLRELDALVQRCLAKAPAARPGSALELITELDRVAATLPATDAPARAPAAVQATVQLPAYGTPDLDSTGRSGWVAQLTPDGEAPVEPPAPHLTPGAAWELPRSQPVSGIADGLEPEVPPGTSRPVRVRRWPIAAGLAVALAIAGAVGWIASRRGAAASGSGSVTGSGSTRDPEVAATVEPVDAAPAAVVAVVPADAASAGTNDAAGFAAVADRSGAAERAERRREEIAEHLAAAEKAHRAGRPLLQQAEADAVLELDRRHPRANFLFGDALIQAKDLTNGCAYLKRARGVAAARARMAEAGCK
jgi:serine/threonine-protein kinase